MEQRALGQSGLNLSVLGFGCGPNARLMVGEDHSAQLAVVQHAIDRGVTYFDTAAAYGAGRSETNLGAVLRELDVAPSLSTKVVLERAHYADVKGSVLRNFEASLKRLQVDRVDALLLHNRVATSREYKTAGSGATLNLQDIFGRNGVLEAFRQLTESGQAATIGFTAFGGEAEAVDQMIASRAFGTLNASYNIVNPSAAAHVPIAYGDADYNRVIDRAQDVGMGVMAIRVLSSGSLVGRYETGSREDRLVRLADELGEDIVSLAIRFVLSNPCVTTAIIGFSEASQVDVAVSAAARGPLEEETVIRLRETALGLRSRHIAI